MNESLAIGLGVGFAIGGVVLGFLLAAVGMTGR
jgi:hypothetical protein